MKRFYMCVLLMVLSLTLISVKDSFSHALRVSDGKVISMEDLVRELKDTDMVFIGEVHDDIVHHRLQLEIIQDMHEAGVPLGVGLEMIRAKDQNELDRWLSGALKTESFKDVYWSFWSINWGLYEKIFHFSRKERIPMIGLNIPESVSRTISQKGFDSLSDEDLRELPPDITCDDINEDYRTSVREVFEQHHWKPGGFENFCEAQVVWDKSMAWRALSYLDGNPGAVVVVLAGTSHAWKHGIPAQVKKASRYKFAVVLPEVPGIIERDSITPREADYLLLTR